MNAVAQDIIRQAAVTLQDAEGVRWPAGELVVYLNDGQRAIVERRPDATATTAAVALVEGARQTLPAAAASLIDIPRNAAGRKRQITKVDQRILDATVPTWFGGTPATEVKHFMHDAREPRVFLVYPPARAGVEVELLYAARPADVAQPSGPLASDVAGPCALGVQWGTALYHFVLFRAYSKDAEFGGNAAQAASHLGLFKAELGEPLQSAAVVAASS